ncbi:MAG: DUF1800 family protein [Gemmataceae bacterium]|nr:DUF1800 family protein [Gemmataceae bacterium]
MFTKKRTAAGIRLALAAAALAVGAAAVAAEPDRLAAARAAIKKAAAEEQKAQDEWNAREMARSATREIGVSARNTADRALQAVLAAQGDGATAKLLGQRLTTLRATVERLFTDQRVANEATDALLIVERTIAAKMQATRAAERIVLALELEAARGAADKSRTDKSRAGADKVRAAERVLREADVVAALEAQAWFGVQADTYRQMAAGNASAADVATRILPVETDAKRKKALQEFVAKVSALRSAHEKAAAEQTAIQRGRDWDIYRLRVAALDGLKLLAPECWDYAKARHLLVRAGFGGTPQEVDQLCRMGPYRAVEFLVEFHRRPSANAPFDAAPPERPDPLEGKVRNAFVRSQVAATRRSSEGGQAGRLRLWWMKRLIESPRPLQEKLTLFWHGHFATQYSVVRNSYTTYHQNQLFREHAAGNFGGLLTGLVHDPVMIRYLDNNTKVKGRANENLAREIMELFAMGEGQGYTEKDIREAARALTGYTFDHFTGQFRFLVKNHDDKPKTVFGKTGNWTGDDLVALLLEQPATARFIARKLFEFFAYQDPAPETVDRLAGVLRTSQYELAPVLQNLFLSEEFYSERAVGTQIKSPIQLLAGMLRDLGVKQVANSQPIEAAARGMGQELLEPPDVKGWRGGRTWINADRLFVRYNAIADLLRNVPRPGGQRGVDVVALLEGCNCKTEAGVVDYLARACFVRPLDEAKRKELTAYLGQLPPPAEWPARRTEVNERLRALLVLMLSTPEYQMM